MERSKTGRFLDNLTICLIATLLLFLLCRTFISNNLVSIIISIVISFILLKILLYFQNKKYTKLNIQKNEIKEISEYNFALRSLTSKEQINFFKEMFKEKNIEIKKDSIAIENKILLINKLNIDQVDNETVFNIYANYKNENYKEIALICNKISQEALNTLSKFDNLPFSIFTPIETYSLMKKYNFFPEIRQTKTKKKPSFIKHAFIQKQAKGFIRCGFLIYFAGIFVPFTKYYLISGSICLIIGALCLCFGKKEPKKFTLSENLLLNLQ